MTRHLATAVRSTESRHRDGGGDRSFLATAFAAAAKLRTAVRCARPLRRCRRIRRQIAAADVSVVALVQE